jgi:DNA-binding GntR family transcriptional regulator
MLRDQIKDVLLQRILAGTYSSGERIKEMRIAEEFGVSQAPVREALRELAILRLVVSEPFKGVRVREVDHADILETYPVRGALEEVAARAAVGRIDDRVKELKNAIDSMRSAAVDQDLHRFVTHDVEFHRLIVTASSNNTLVELWQSLHVDLRTRFTLIQRTADLPEVAEAHVPILEALVAGDGDLAGRRVREHIEGFGRWVATQLHTAPVGSE